MDNTRLDWIPAYKAIATALLGYENRQEELAALIGGILGESYTEMDPLTFFSAFNGKRSQFAARTQAVSQIIAFLGLDVAAPNYFDAIPVTNAMRWRFWDGKPDTVGHNWRLFRAALAFADDPSPSNRGEFTEAFDVVRAHGNVGDANLSMALYWARPEDFLPLDANTRAYLSNCYDIEAPSPITGEQYLTLLKRVREATDAPFVEISFCAWELSGWIPAPTEYDPEISAAQWSELLRDESIATKDTLIALGCLGEHPDGATCTELANEFGRDANYYLSAIATLGERVSGRLGIPAREAGHGGKFWPIPCVGSKVGKRRPGTFAWRLRPELREALGSVSLGGISLKKVEFDCERLGKLISLYKQDFHRFRGPDAPEGDQESYKWDDVIAYSRNWDIDAEDFGDRLKIALKPAATGQGAILGNGFSYPYAKLVKLVGFDAEGIREAFRNLYDSSKPLRDAYQAFADKVDEVLHEFNGASGERLDGSHQTPSAASVYLFFEHPDRFHYYKPSIAADFAGILGSDLMTDPVTKFARYEELCDQVLPLVLEDKELVALLDSVLTDEQRAADPAHHLLLQDIAYYSSRYMPKWHEDWKSLLGVDSEEAGMEAAVKTSIPKNLILYGPPGTGKTYSTKAFAVAICDGRSVADVLEEMSDVAGYEKVVERYRQLKDEGRIGFTTFHQSYGYEEFIEGIRPETDDERGTVTYPLKDGVFKEFCKAAEGIAAEVSARAGVPSFADNPRPRVWKMGLSASDVPNLLEQCRRDGCLRLGWDGIAPSEVAESEDISYMNKRAILAFQEDMRPGDFAVIPGTSSHTYGVAVITGDFEWRTDLEAAKRYRKALWLNNVSKGKFVDQNGGKQLTLQSVYELTRVSATELLELMGIVQQTDEATEADPYVFIIDEINRGNVSKVFGELITLIEPSKRKGEPEQLSAKLPYSKTDFSVPSNIFILGTMNTADRSIALMDTALRRRFDFAELMPQPELLEGIDVGGIEMHRMLEAINRRIELLYDREHTLGHAYFMSLRENPDIDALARIFDGKIIPLLQEYCFDDYAKIRSVLGAAADRFVKETDSSYVFWSEDENAPDQIQAYEILRAPCEADAYKLIYER